jgi:hypothetical protein
LTLEETDACFIVKDCSGISLAYVYFEEKPAGERRQSCFTRDEARRIAANIAKLPEFVTKGVSNGNR